VTTPKNWKRSIKPNWRTRLHAGPACRASDSFRRWTLLTGIGGILRIKAYDDAAEGLTAGGITPGRRLWASELIKPRPVAAFYVADGGVEPAENRIPKGRDPKEARKTNQLEFRFSLISKLGLLQIQRRIPFTAAHELAIF